MSVEKHIDESYFVYHFDLRMLLISSFRYALGRQTYIVGICTELLRKYWHVLTAADQELIISDINDAFKLNQISPIDDKRWRSVLALSPRGVNQV